MKKTTANFLVLCGLAGAGVLPAIACGGSHKPADTGGEPSATSALEETPGKTGGPADSASSATLDTSASAAPTDEAPGPLAQVLTTDAGQIIKMFQAASAAPPATLKANGVTGGDPLAKGVRDAAKRLPAGMQPDGPMAMGSIKEKQHLQADITLQPGKCYSIVGYSKKVKDLDLYLLLPPGVLSGQDLTDDSRPVIGGPPQPMCPASSTAITYKLDIYADAGAGDVAVQLYSKSK
ncbi:MAG TPA: hypothetical protein VIF15_10635 [Polyangiaceae bacterium]|jgi:hypothetical protein